MGGTVNVSAGGMDGGMDHESRGVEKADRTGLVLDVTRVVDEKKVFRLDEREVQSEWVHPKTVRLDWVL